MTWFANPNEVVSCDRCRTEISGEAWASDANRWSQIMLYGEQDLDICDDCGVSLGAWILEPGIKENQ